MSLSLEEKLKLILAGLEPPPLEVPAPHSDNYLIIGLDRPQVEYYQWQEFPVHVTDENKFFYLHQRGRDTSKNLIGMREFIIHLSCDPIEFSDDFIMKAHRLMMGPIVKFAIKSQHDDFLWHLNMVRERLGMSILKKIGMSYW